MERFVLFAQDIKQAFRAVPQPDATEARVTTALDQVLIAVGIISVLMVLIGAIRYAYSQGSPDKVAQAKNTIIYAIVGVVITAFAYAIVSFVEGRLWGQQ